MTSLESSVLGGDDNRDAIDHEYTKRHFCGFPTAPRAMKRRWREAASTNARKAKGTATASTDTTPAKPATPRASASTAASAAAVAGDFFEGVPPGADAYVLSWILHDWGDEIGPSHPC